jgi:hypothetical protein
MTTQREETSVVDQTIPGTEAGPAGRAPSRRTRPIDPSVLKGIERRERQLNVLYELLEETLEESYLRIHVAGGRRDEVVQRRKNEFLQGFAWKLRLTAAWLDGDPDEFQTTNPPPQGVA